MSAHWFRVPPWVNTIRQGEKATRSEAAIDLLNRWDKGERAHMRMLMDAWGWSHDRISTFVVEVWEWAVENGAVCPPTPLPVNRTKSHSGRTTPAQPPHTDRTHESASNVNNQDGAAQQSHTDRTVTAQSSHAPCARIPLETDVDGRRETQEPIHVPPVPVATPSPATQEPPCAAPPQAISTSVPVSTAKEAMNTQPGLFGAAIAGTVEPPKAAPPKEKKPATKPKKPAVNEADVAAVFAEYLLYKPTAGVKDAGGNRVPSDGDRKRIVGALQDWEVGRLVNMIRWANTSSHPRAKYLKDNDYTFLSNLLTDKIEERLLMAEEGTKGPAFGAHPTPEGGVFGRVEPKQAKPSALPPNFQKPQKVSGIDAAADMWDYAQELKTNNQQQSEAM